MNELARVIGARSSLMTSPGEIGSIVVQQAYQRAIGASATIENEDDFLVAMAEVVGGSWSVDISYRVLSSSLHGFQVKVIQLVLTIGQLMRELET